MAGILKTTFVNAFLCWKSYNLKFTECFYQAPRLELVSTDSVVGLAPKMRQTIT